MLMVGRRVSVEMLTRACNVRLQQIAAGLESYPYFLAARYTVGCLSDDNTCARDPSRAASHRLAPVRLGWNYIQKGTERLESRDVLSRHKDLCVRQ